MPLAYEPAAEPPEDFSLPVPIGYPALYFVEPRERGTVTVWNLTGDDVDWSALDWRARALLRGALLRTLAQIGGAP